MRNPGAFFSCLMLISLPVRGELVSSEFDALRDLYFGTNGNSWRWNTDPSSGVQWNFKDPSADPCSDHWQGISCLCDTMEECHVVSLTLTSYALSGSIPQTIGNFGNLSSLTLNKNSLIGAIPIPVSNLVDLTSLVLDTNKLSQFIPSQLGNLKALTKFSFYSNCLSGTIPSILGSLISLTTFSVNSNRLRGPMPSELGYLVHLTILNLYSNSFSGSIPSSFGLLSSLTTFSVDTNKLSQSIPSELGNLKAATKFSLNSNSLTGTIPSSFGFLISVTALTLNSNRLRGPIPSELGYLVHLTTLGLNSNSFSGSIPSSLGLLTSLTTFSVDTNKLSQSIPSELGNLKAATKFTLYGNCLSGTIPTTLALLTSLSSLSLDVNRLHGPIPSEFGTMTKLTALYLYTNFLSGFIPTTLAQLTLLTTLTLDSNFLSGWIPTGLGNLKKLTQFKLYDNRFSGPIPTLLAQLTSLTAWDFNFNSLTGAIPTLVCDLTKLQAIQLGNNFLTGTLPSCLGGLTKMSSFSVSSNFMQGPIPTSLGNWTGLGTIFLNSNRFSGEIPSSLGNLRMLDKFVLYENSLSGTIPSELGMLSSITYFQVYTNDLRGPIPSELGNLRLCYFLGLFGNSLTGTIPSSLGAMTKLNFFGLFYNFLTGTIPPEIGSIGSSLATLLIYGNSLTGTLPPLSSLLNLNSFSIFTNNLSGSLPSGIELISTLKVFSVHSNKLTGTLPLFLHTTNLDSILAYDNCFTGSLSMSFDTLPVIKYFDVANNHLTSTIPTSISRSTSIKTMLLFGNMLEGSLDEIFSKLQLSLTNVDVSKNQLTSTIPSEVFKLGLLSFAAAENCISGSIPSAICAATGLTDLVIDGLAAASSCQTKYFPKSASLTSYFITKFTTNNIPSCVYSMSDLGTLHASGNGIQGSIEDDVVIGPNLTDLALSHNRLTGAIPLSIQNRHWSALDLSYNKLSGTLSSVADLSVSGSLYLQVNRLSGEVPGTLKRIPVIGVLTGNIFSCDTSKSSLPPNDPEYDRYECDSQSLYFSMYTWAACCGAFSIAVVVMAIRAQQCTSDGQPSFTSKLKIWLDNLPTGPSSTHLLPESDALVQFLGIIRFVRQTVVLIMVVVVVTFIPIYAVLSTTFATYELQYAWTVSSGYISGFDPAVVLLVFYVLFTAFLGLLMWRYKRFAGSYVAQASSQRVTSMYHFTSETLKQNLMSIAVVVLNCIVVIVVNAAFVYVVINADSSTVVVSEMLLSWFKIVWPIITDKLLSQIEDKVLDDDDDGDESGVLSKEDTMKVIGINGTNPSGIAVPQSRGAGSRLRAALVIFNNIVTPCLATAALSSTCFYNIFVSPPLITSSYDYEDCVTFSAQDSSCKTVAPVVNTITFAPPFLYSYQCSSELISSYSTVFTYQFIAVAFITPLKIVLLAYLEKTSFVPRWVKDAVVPTILQPLDTQSPPPSSLFSTDAFVVGIFTHVAIMTTFGVTFPPLSVIIAVATIIDTICTQLLVRRCIDDCDVQMAQQHKKRLLQDLASVGAAMGDTLQLLPPCVIIFYSIFIFDTLGDRFGPDVGAIGFAVLPACAVLALSVIAVARLLRAREREYGDGNGDGDAFVEKGGLGRESARRGADNIDVYIRMDD